MKNMNLKIMMMAICLFALCLTAFGQAPGGKIKQLPDRKTNDALTRVETLDPKIKEGMIQALKVGKMNFPKPPPPPKGMYVSQTGEKYSFAQAEVSPTRKELVEGVNVGVIYVEANSKQLPNGYYTVQIKQSGKDEKGNPIYDINLFNSSGVQALSIGAKTNGAAGNTNGTGAKREAMPQGNSGDGATPTDPKVQALSIGAKTNGSKGDNNTNGMRDWDKYPYGCSQGDTGYPKEGCPKTANLATSESTRGSAIAGSASAKTADYEALGKQMEDFAPKFVNNGGKETLSTDGLDTQIVNAIRGKIIDRIPVREIKR